jgi:hypothetical protein
MDLTENIGVHLAALVKVEPPKHEGAFGCSGIDGLIILPSFLTERNMGDETLWPEYTLGLRSRRFGMDDDRIQLALDDLVVCDNSSPD